jgi:putative redox protein
MASSARMTVHLDWQGDLRFKGVVDGSPVAVDGNGESAASPVQTLATGLAGCMAIDVVHILEKLRTPATALSVELTVQRAESDPRRVVSTTMKFTVGGDVPDKNVQRALDMSRDTYCSVWQSLRQDIAFESTFEVRPT